MKNNSTELVFILDRSGSMAGLESDTIGGFNSLIEKQKKLDEKCYVSTVLFNQVSEVVHDRVDLEQIKSMTDDDYIPGGCTALIDAIGDAIKHIKNVHKYIREEDVPEHTLFAIMTDGYENAIRKYSDAEVKKMIEKQKEEGWEFLFVGANIDSVSTAKGFGINQERAVNYHADHDGTRVAFCAVSETVAGLRKTGKVEESWSESIARDYEDR